MNQTISIYLADDHELVANGITLVLKKSFSHCSVETFRNGQLLFESTKEKQPDLIFLDYEMPVWDGKTTLIALQQKFPQIPVLMLSMVNEKFVIQDCINHGALGFVNKDCTVEEFKSAIDSAMNGKVYYSREVLKVLSGIEPTAFNQTVFKHDLSEREMDVLRLLCDGLSPREIGEKIFLSPRTVEKHKDNIMSKLELNSVAKLIAFSLKNKIV